MVLDHLEIGGTVVDLASASFGGIVLTLALAIGLGSRDLVSRSIEKNRRTRARRRPIRSATRRRTRQAAHPIDTLRHF